MTHIDATLRALLMALGSATLKSTVMVASAAVLVRLLRRRSAALRHMVWTAALGSTLAVVILPVILPAWHVVPMPAVSATFGAADAPRAMPPVVDVAAVGAPEHSSPSAIVAPSSDPSVARGPVSVARSAAPPPSRREPEWPLVLFALWMLGVVGVLTRYAWSKVALVRLARSSTLMAGRDEVAEGVLRDYRISRSVSFRQSSDVELPLTWGIFRPQVVLPMDASEWNPDCRLRVLQHELAHVKRYDAATQLVEPGATAMFWFNPLIWYAVGQMRCERERACDDYVLSGGAVASDYASDLLTLVTTHGYVERHSGAMAFARRSHFEGRLLALLDRTIERGVPSRLRAGVALSLSVGMVVPLAALSARTGTVQQTVRHLAAVVTPRLATGATPLAPSAPVSAAPAAPQLTSTSADLTSPGSTSSAADSSPAMAGPRERPIGPVIASWPGPMRGLVQVRELSNGTVLIWDESGGGPIQVIDAPLATASVVLAAPRADSMMLGGRTIPTIMREDVIPYQGDSLLAFLGDRMDAVTALTLIDPTGKPMGTRQFPLLLRIWSKLNGSIRLDPAVDARGRSVFIAYPAAPYTGDSAWLDRADLVAGRADSVVRVRIASGTKQVRTTNADGRATSHVFVMPVNVDDSWGVLSDGTIMVVRAIGCRVEDVGADGMIMTFPLSACNEHPLSLAEREQLVHSVKVAGRGADSVASDIPGAPTVDDMPKAVPAYESIGAVADREGHLWVHVHVHVHETATTEGWLYDVISQGGTVVDRVRLPLGRRLVGFGVGVAYLSAPDSAAPAVRRLERVRIH